MTTVELAPRLFPAISVVVTSGWVASWLVVAMASRNIAELIRRAAEFLLLGRLRTQPALAWAVAGGEHRLGPPLPMSAQRRAPVPSYELARPQQSAAPEEEPASEVADVLTPRQLDVVRLAVSGLTAKETARRLGISKNTVDEHLQDARRRVGVATKSRLIGWAVMAGILPE